jgi:GNAT superfamily N-acetyltransferase
VDQASAIEHLEPVARPWPEPIPATGRPSQRRTDDHLMPDADAPALAVRAATPDDDPAVLVLLQASMGWVPDEQYAQFFVWKHRQSPFGASPAWVATDPGDDDRIVGFRTYVRWQFLRQGELAHGVRAVDTVTHPDYQGRGIFSLLTRQSLDDLVEGGVNFVFNTPNDKSRPGYLKMGWQRVDRLSPAARPRSALALVRLARARTPADKWSTDCSAGVPAVEALADEAALDRLLAAVAGTPGPAATSAEGDIVTNRTPDYLRWRYGFPPLKYRAVVAPGGLDDGVAIFRLRRRGAATEAALTELLVPGNDTGVIRDLLSEILRGSGADYAVWLGPPRPSLGFLPVPGQGPTLVWKAVTDEGDAPEATRWGLTLGDIELF